MRPSHVQGKQPHLPKASFLEIWPYMGEKENSPKWTGWMEAWWMSFSFRLSIYHSWFPGEYGWIRWPCPWRLKTQSRQFFIASWLLLQTWGRFLQDATTNEQRTKPITSAKGRGWNGHRFLCVPYRSWGFGVRGHEMSKWLKKIKAEAAEWKSSNEKIEAAEEEAWAWIPFDKHVEQISFRQCLTFCEHGQLKGWQQHFQLTEAKNSISTILHCFVTFVTWKHGADFCKMPQQMALETTNQKF